MTDEPNDTSPPDSAAEDTAERLTGNELSAEDERTWRLWVQGVAMSEYRNHSKAIAWLARLAMIDDDFRDELINDTENAMNQRPTGLPLPEGPWTYRFIENTQDV